MGPSATDLLPPGPRAAARVQAHAPPERRRATDDRTTSAAPPAFAVLTMTRVRVSAIPWVLWRVARGAAVLGPVPGLAFARVLGSGRDGGFGLHPGWDCQGVFAAFTSLTDAHAFAWHSATARAYEARAVENFTAVLQVLTSRGSWGGQRMGAPAEAATVAVPGPIAALTRAAIRPLAAHRFWPRSPPAERALAAAEGCRVAVGLGEAPLLRQATFSLWDDAPAMDRYARQGAHRAAIEAAWGGRYFSESMFVRFRPVAVRGSWRGVPLGLEDAP